MEECIFCKIGQGKVKSDVLFSDALCFVIRDINPAAPTHLLVLPHEHLTSLDSKKEAVLGHMLAVAHEMARREGIEQKGYRLVMNLGQDAGQVMAHLHLHIMGGRALRTMG